MFDKIEEVAMRWAAKGYLCVAVAGYIYILWRGSVQIIFAASVMLGGFVAYCYLSPDNDYEDDE